MARRAHAGASRLVLVSHAAWFVRRPHLTTVASSSRLGTPSWEGGDVESCDTVCDRRWSVTLAQVLSRQN